MSKTPGENPKLGYFKNEVESLVGNAADLNEDELTLLTDAVRTLNLNIFNDAHQGKPGLKEQIKAALGVLVRGNWYETLDADMVKSRDVLKGVSPEVKGRIAKLLVE